MKKTKELFFGMLIVVSIITFIPIIINYLWGSSASSITNIPLFALIVLVQLVCTIYGGSLIGDYINSNYLS